jgi:asparagine synthase (glutamine-hydrolysing)
MCGIAGIFSYKNTLSNASIKLMTEMLRYRGPDDEGYLAADTNSKEVFGLVGSESKAKGNNIEAFHGPANLYFGHRRLSILDLSPLGHQPMSNSNKTSWIVHNGEIYNYRELREELTNLGYSFISNTDTEVILASYREWGQDCVNRFNGMWAFAIYDKNREVLFCSRDRFGIKPFYYAEINGLFAFASEIKQFSALEGWRARLNKQRAYDFLAGGISDHTQETLFAGVYQLRGGHNLIYDLRRNKYEVRQWYRLEDKIENQRLDFNEVRERFFSLFQDSVSIRLRSDVKVGSCLSGGLDSSSIVCMLNSLLKDKDLNHFQEVVSSCFEIKKYDEQDYIDEVVRQTGVASHRVYPRYEELFPELDKIAWHQDEPFISTSIFAQWNVFRAARENGITVMLDGQGADELLAGYPGFYKAFFLLLLRQLNLFSFLRELLSFKRIHNYSCGNLFRQVREDVLGSRNPLQWLNSDSDVEARPFWINSDSIRSLSLSQLVYSNLPMLLHFEDRDSMAFSVEARLPFLDYRLVEFVLGLPDEYKINHGRTKYILRESLSKVLPDKISRRYDKIGFITPEEVWMKQDSARFRAELEETVALSGGIINKGIIKYFEEMVAGQHEFSFDIWRAISFGRWLKVFNVWI